MTASTCPTTGSGTSRRKRTSDRATCCTRIRARRRARSSSTRSRRRRPPATAPSTSGNCSGWTEPRWSLVPPAATGQRCCSRRRRPTAARYWRGSSMRRSAWPDGKGTRESCSPSSPPAGSPRWPAWPGSGRRSIYRRPRSRTAPPAWTRTLSARRGGYAIASTPTARSSPRPGGSSGNAGWRTAGKRRRGCCITCRASTGIRSTPSGCCARRWPARRGPCHRAAWCSPARTIAGSPESPSATGGGRRCTGGSPASITPGFAARASISTSPCTNHCATPGKRGCGAITWESGRGRPRRTGAPRCGRCGRRSFPRTRGRVPGEVRAPPDSTSSTMPSPASGWPTSRDAAFPSTRRSGGCPRNWPRPAR